MMVGTLQHEDDQAAAAYVAFDYFNEHLFGGKLERCEIDVRFVVDAGGLFVGSTPPVIMMRPSYHDDMSWLSNLAHEMAHYERYLDSPHASHDEEWAAIMERIGLIPTDNGHLSGNKTGPRKGMGHIIVCDGPFSRAAVDLLRAGFRPPQMRIADRVALPFALASDRIAKFHRSKLGGRWMDTIATCVLALEIWSILVFAAETPPWLAAYMSISFVTAFWLLYLVAIDLFRHAKRRTPSSIRALEAEKGKE
jgi:hypothetical protein